MKKLMSLMLGLSIALGSFAMFAQDTTETSKSTTKTKKMTKTKKAKTKTSLIHQLQQPGAKSIMEMTRGLEGMHVWVVCLTRASGTCGPEPHHDHWTRSEEH